jgi:hypothetical protein
VSANGVARIVLFAAFVHASIFGVSMPASAETIVQADYGWAYAKSSCLPGWLKDAAPEKLLACSDAEANFEEFVARLETQFASNSLCADVYIVRVGPRPPGTSAITAEASRNLSEYNWRLWINFNIGVNAQYWYVSSKDWQLLFQGEGIPEKIAHDVCAAVKGRGANITR